MARRPFFGDFCVVFFLQSIEWHLVATVLCSDDTYLVVLCFEPLFLSRVFLLCPMYVCMSERTNQDCLRVPGLLCGF